VPPLISIWLVLTDLVGTWGAVLVSLPVIRRQRVRDAIITFQMPEEKDEANVTLAARKALTELQILVGKHADKDYKQTIVGTILIALAFGLKIIAYGVEFISSF